MIENESTSGILRTSKYFRLYTINHNILTLYYKLGLAKGVSLVTDKGYLISTCGHICFCPSDFMICCQCSQSLVFCMVCKAR